MTPLCTLLKNGSDVLVQTFTVLVYRPSFLGNCHVESKSLFFVVLLAHWYIFEQEVTIFPNNLCLLKYPYVIFEVTTGTFQELIHSNNKRIIVLKLCNPNEVVPFPIEMIIYRIQIRAVRSGTKRVLFFTQEYLICDRKLYKFENVFLIIITIITVIVVITQSNSSFLRYEETILF
ncbi:hypothetical protein ANN_26209 [Periplaneta americana]|uniref:Uncharacterized protein n=1 Tax=Periplaneta americana TaxID=6978 RepID=A0ABQ8S5B3_PERAM|nr:hypothetical protein ANN_26209 [Periplaneta americana]